MNTYFYIMDKNTYFEIRILILIDEMLNRHIR